MYMSVYIPLYGSSQRKHAAMLDVLSDDDNSSVSSASIMWSDMSAHEEVHVQKDTLLDQALEALFEKRGTTREKTLGTIIKAFNSELQHEFVDKKFTTLVHQFIASIKKVSANEIALAAHTIEMLALKVESGDRAREII